MHVMFKGYSKGLGQGFSKGVMGLLPGSCERNRHFGLQFTFGMKWTKSEMV